MEHLDCIEELHAARALLGAIAREFVGEVEFRDTPALDEKVRALIHEFLRQRARSDYYEAAYRHFSEAHHRLLMGLARSVPGPDSVPGEQ